MSKKTITIEELATKMDAGFEKSDARFDALIKKMDAGFEKIDTRFIASEKSTSVRFTAIEDQIERLAIITMQGFEQVNKRFEQVDKRFDGIEKQINFMTCEIATIKGELYRMGQKIDDLEEQVKAINKCTKEDVDMALKDIMGMKKRLGVLEIEYRSRKVA